MSFETFISLKNEHRTKIKIKRSEFIATAAHVKNEPEAKEFISQISTEFKDATHNCWAYKIEKMEHSSDAGEPSGTAGKPILGTIKSLKLDKIVVVVTRYFGGVKLGIRGLIEAYSAAARKVLEEADKEEFLIGKKVKVELDYQNFDRMAYRFRKAGYFYSSPPYFAEKIIVELFLPSEEKVDFPFLESSHDEISKEELIKI